MATNIDRSLAFTALLDLSPEFCKMSFNAPETNQMIEDLLAAWEGSDSTDMFEFSKQWLYAKKVDEELTWLEGGGVSEFSG